jgi:putative ABC transport system substrate-binding protein
MRLQGLGERQDEHNRQLRPSMSRDRPVPKQASSPGRRDGTITRRDGVRLLAGTSFAVAFGARAQQQSIPVIGFLSDRSAAGDAHLVEAFRRGLVDAGFIDGKNVSIEFRFADGKSASLDALAAGLVDRHVTVILAAGGISSVAARAATATIPIVFVSTSDPLAYHLVSSLSRPGGNVTGISLTAVTLAPKRLDLLFELLPRAKDIALLVNPTTTTTTPFELKDVQVVAKTRGLELSVVNVISESDFDAAFASIRQAGADALLVGTDPLFVKARDQLVALAARYAIPAVYDRREFTEAGGLMSYGASIAAGYHRGGVYTGKILKGAKPSDLPVEQAATFELVINIRTAKSLGIAVPPSVLAGANEVIE